MSFSSLKTNLIASLFCGLLVTGCAHRMLVTDSGIHPSAWLAAQGALQEDDTAALSNLRRYARELTGSPRLLRIMFSAADPVTQALARQVAAGNLIRILPPSQWQSGWLRSLVRANPELLLPVERIQLRSEERRVGKECRSRWSPAQ